MKYIYDETIELKRILENGFYGAQPSYKEIFLLAKKHRMDGLGEVGIYKKIVSYMESLGTENMHFYEGRIRDASRRAIKNSTLRTPSYPIGIFEKDISLIRKIKNFSYQKIVFSSLVFARSHGNPTIFSSSGVSVRHIIEISGERLSLRRFIEDISPVANSLGIFVFNKGRFSFYRVLESGGSRATVSIEDNYGYENSGKVYESFIGGVLHWCKEDGCENEFIREGSNNKYCFPCSQKRNAKRVQKFREKSL